MRVDHTKVPCTRCNGPRDHANARCRRCLAELRRERRRQNPERERGVARARYRRDREKYRAEARARYAKNPEPYKRQAEQWRRRNPAKRSRIVSLHRDKRRAAGGRGVTSAQWRAILARTGGHCVYCLQPGRTIDHFVPIVRGGYHDVANVVPSCRKCNSAKHTHDPITWASLNAGPPALARALSVVMHAVARWGEPE